eukprot:m.455934 g.455934  ORF g.455934 m.455934 type:complete len:413 (+) comp20966_c0_seq1:252-1490(+)
MMGQRDSIIVVVVLVCGVGTLSNGQPTAMPTTIPTTAPTGTPTAVPTTQKPSAAPTSPPSRAPTAVPTNVPSVAPTEAPSAAPSSAPTREPTTVPTATPTGSPQTLQPTAGPTSAPTVAPTQPPTAVPTELPTLPPTAVPTNQPTTTPPSVSPTLNPTREPTVRPSEAPTARPSLSPTSPTLAPTATPTTSPTLFNNDASTGDNDDITTPVVAGVVVAVVILLAVLLFVLKPNRPAKGHDSPSLEPEDSAHTYEATTHFRQPSADSNFNQVNDVLANIYGNVSTGDTPRSQTNQTTTTGNEPTTAQAPIYANVKRDKPDLYAELDLRGGSTDHVIGQDNDAVIYTTPAVAIATQSDLGGHYAAVDFANSAKSSAPAAVEEDVVYAEVVTDSKVRPKPPPVPGRVQSRKGSLL